MGYHYSNNILTIGQTPHNVDIDKNHINIIYSNYDSGNTDETLTIIHGKYDFVFEYYISNNILRNYDNCDGDYKYAFYAESLLPYLSKNLSNIREQNMKTLNEIDNIMEKTYKLFKELFMEFHNEFMKLTELPV